ncbi:MAG: META domain-containing protein [Alphaproteobacteria bacterium]|nr:META domain-containing protein [Alphaproteobacteria bacterium]
MRRIASTAIVLALALGLAGCESAVSDDSGRDDARLTQSDWVAETITGKPVVHVGRVTLSFAEGRVSGRGGCNLYSGPVEYGKGAIKIGPLISTKMACMEDGLMQQESAYLTALQGADRYAVGADGKLTIATRTGAIVYDSAPRQVRPEN